MLLTRIALLLVAAVLAACSGVPLEPGSPGSSAPAVSGWGGGPASSSGALSHTAYKHELANHIARASAPQVYGGRPQALLRSVIVVRYQVDANGRLMRSDILRSNQDRATEATALAALRKAAPFPRPAAHLLRQGRVEVLETWLFNNDGRFQLRTIAEPQQDE